jgi:hypothetical protein
VARPDAEGPWTEADVARLTANLQAERFSSIPPVCIVNTVYFVVRFVSWTVRTLSPFTGLRPSCRDIAPF